MAKGAMALLAMLAPKKRASVEPEDKGSFASEGKIAAAEDILAAIKKGDAMALSDALEAHAACCAEMGDDDDEGPKSGRY